MTNNFEQETKTNMSCRTRSGIQVFKDPGFRLGGRNDSRKSFTLIELLVVLALVAILSVVVVMTLNPAELLKQARDSNRLSDLATINTALNLFSTDVTSGFMGTSTVIYVSIPDTSPTCANLGLPTLPTSTINYTYNCTTLANLRNTNGTGWIPVNFQSISSNSPISQLPIDPINTTSTGKYYTYISGGSWILTAIPESQKQKTELSATPQITNYPGIIGMGNNLSLSPLYNPNGLVGYWKFDEGSGAIAKDSSGNGNNATWGGTGVHYAAGKIGPYSGRFNGSDDYADAGDPASGILDFGTNPFTVIFWAQSSTCDSDGYLAKKSSLWALGAGWSFACASSPKLMYVTVDDGTTHAENGTNITSFSEWRMVGLIRDSEGKIYYINNGVITYSGRTVAGSVSNSDPLRFTGVYGLLNGLLDDVRLYNRALSAAEILALYNSTR